MNPGQSERPINVLPKGCVCGHDHTTHRGEYVEMCLECSCIEMIRRCQNCGAEVLSGVVLVSSYDACSRRCAMQLEYADARKAAA